MVDELDQPARRTDQGLHIDGLASGQARERRGDERGAAAHDRVHRDQLVVLDRGYAQVTVSDIARAAGTAVKLDSLGALGAGADVEKCADLLWFCLGLGAWRTLVDECGWSWDEAEAELTSVAMKLLLKAG